MNESNDAQKLIEPVKNFRAGYVAVIGLPNVGKSTLLNHLVKTKLSIVTPKPQTTRKNVLGILNAPEYQIVFMDTPGIIEPRYNLQKFMMRYVRNAVQDADGVVYMLDITNPRQRPAEVQEQLRAVAGKPVILAVNKIDQKERGEILPFIEKFQQVHPFRAIVPIAAIYNDGLDQLLTEIVQCLPFSPPYYPTDYISDQQERFFVAEIIREKIFTFYHKEVPYATHVEIEEFTENEDGKDYIRAVILVERKTQKGILIGKKGEALKRIGEAARRDIEQFLGRPVFLELFVKVAPDWRKKDAMLRRLGFA